MGLVKEALEQFMHQERRQHANGNNQEIPLEVALHQKVQHTDSGPGAAVTLLDWFNLEQEVILDLERPDPCMDLVDYMYLRGHIPECEAKIIAKQLVDALMEMESRGVFHRDIKPENILIEIGSDVPRVRIINFGCGTFLSEGFYTRAKGTRMYFPPELYRNRCFRARQTTVWQLGVMMYEMLHGDLPFEDTDDIMYMEPQFNNSLSICCQNFVQGCLTKDPETRATLQSLKGHPWLDSL